MCGRTLPAIAFSEPYKLKCKECESKAANGGFQLAVDIRANVDWEQRRYEVAKDILSARCFGASLGQVSTREILQSIMLADAFINELIERSGVNDS